MAGSPAPLPHGRATLEVSWLGHATSDIRIGGTRTASDTGVGVDRFVTDPVLRDRCAHLRRHRGSGVLDDPGSVSGILISHLHHDHLDLPSLRRLPRGLPCVVSRGAGPLLRGTGLDVIELDVEATVTIGSTVVTVVPAEHQPDRFASRHRAPPVGYVLQRADRTVYFPGDTDLHPVMSDLPRPDVALLPIWGWGPTIGPGHLDPHRAARAAALLGADAVLPVHWGTFAPIGFGRSIARWFDRPAQELEAAIREVSPHTALRLVHPGSDVHAF